MVDSVFNTASSAATSDSNVSEDAWIEPRTSVADPGCLSRIPDTDFYPSRISDPKTATKERGKKN